MKNYATKRVSNTIQLERSLPIHSRVQKGIAWEAGATTSCDLYIIICLIVPYQPRFGHVKQIVVINPEWIDKDEVLRPKHAQWSAERYNLEPKRSMYEQCNHQGLQD